MEDQLFNINKCRILPLYCRARIIETLLIILAVSPDAY